jgi:hypothetical protein
MADVHRCQKDQPLGCRCCGLGDIPDEKRARENGEIATSPARSSNVQMAFRMIASGTEAFVSVVFLIRASSHVVIRTTEATSTLGG